MDPMNPYPSVPRIITLATFRAPIIPRYASIPPPEMKAATVQILRPIRSMLNAQTRRTATCAMFVIEAARSDCRRLEVIHGVVEARHPIVQTVGDEVGAGPQQPDDQRARSIKTGKKFGPSSALGRGSPRCGDRRGDRCNDRCGGWNSARSAGFDLLDNLFRFRRRPWEISHRGDSGRRATRNVITSPGMPPNRKIDSIQTPERTTRRFAPWPSAPAEKSFRRAGRISPGRARETIH